jgi:uncharacterized protein YjbI with pentapeptide repeats
MTATRATERPRYPYCGRGADTQNTVGCRGRLVQRLPANDAPEPEPFNACLAHLSDSDRNAYFASLRPGADLDHRGTTIDAPLLASLLWALRTGNRSPSIGAARFSYATFVGVADFSLAQFTGKASFIQAEFEDRAKFGRTQFKGRADFNKAHFKGRADFEGVTFEGEARFGQAHFMGVARFDAAQFATSAEFDSAQFHASADFNEAHLQGHAHFRAVQFNSSANFPLAEFRAGAEFSRAQFKQSAHFFGVHFKNGANFKWVQFKARADFHEASFKDFASFREAQFEGDAAFKGTLEESVDFHRAKFSSASQIGPLVCLGTVDLSAAVFSSAVTIEIAAKQIDCRRTRWASTAVLRLRRAAVDLSDAVLEYPVSVATDTAPASWTDIDVHMYRPPSAEEPRVRVMSLRGVDASHLVLAEVDLSQCHFAGTIRLDQLRLHGRCELATTPQWWYRRGLLPMRWTSRQTLAEEQHWRAAQRRGRTGWRTGPSEGALLEPAAIAPVYRELRKSFEDAKNEPGAADFYYGECEMRRHDRHSTAAERMLLWLYWALSGYGLRASRALGWLLGAMTVTVLLMMLWGLPQHSPQQKSTGTIDGSRITMTTDTPNPANPEGPLLERLTGDRLEPAVRVVINSAVFRSSGKELTTFGTYTEMVSRFTEPVLLGLAVLAIRNRVKR